MCDRPVDRRTMLMAMGRYSMAGGVAAGIGYLVTRAPGRGDELSCLKQIVCGQCGQFSGCELGQAQAFRRGIRASSGVSDA